MVLDDLVKKADVTAGKHQSLQHDPCMAHYEQAVKNSKWNSVIRGLQKLEPEAKAEVF